MQLSTTPVRDLKHWWQLSKTPRTRFGEGTASVSKWLNDGPSFVYVGACLLLCLKMNHLLYNRVKESANFHDLFFRPPLSNGSQSTEAFGTGVDRQQLHRVHPERYVVATWLPSFQRQSHQPTIAIWLQTLETHSTLLSTDEWKTEYRKKKLRENQRESKLPPETNAMWGKGEKERNKKEPNRYKSRHKKDNK